MGTLFSASRGAHLLFTSDLAKLLNIMLTAMKVQGLLPHHGQLLDLNILFCFHNQRAQSQGANTFNIMLLWEGRQFSSQQTCYLHSLSQCPFIHLGQEEQDRVKCLAQGHNMQPTQGSNSGPWDHESGSSTFELPVTVTSRTTSWPLS